MSPRSYRLTVEGELGDLVRQQAFAGAAVAFEEGNTVLVARDQAELMALLRRASDLGLTVLSATRADERTHPAP
jgi:hypothetical protein